MKNSSPSSLPILHECESPVAGDFFAVSDDTDTGLRINRAGNGYIGMQLPNDLWARFDFAAPGLAAFIWGSARPDNVPWVIEQMELPATLVPSASLRRLYLLTCAPLPVYLCAFSPSVITKEDARIILDTVPDVMLFALRKTTVVNPKYESVVRKWRIA